METEDVYLLFTHDVADSSIPHSLKAVLLSSFSSRASKIALGESRSSSSLGGGGAFR